MTKISITDNQRAVLEAAARSSNLVAWPIPAKLKLNAGAATIVLKGLLKKALVEERQALGVDAVWCKDEDGRPLTVVITKAGLAAVGMLPAGEGLDGSAGEPASTAPDDEQPAPPPETSPTAGDTGPTAAVSDHVKAPRPGSKLAAIVALLVREEGATVEEMAAATGWQAHSVRGAMSGALAKKFRLRISSEPVEGKGRVYRLGQVAERAASRLAWSAQLVGVAVKHSH